MKHYCYMLLCADGSYYTGYTTDLKRRLAEHNGEIPSKGAKYTRARRPCRLVWYEEFDEKSQAMSKEWHIKKLSRKDKLQLVKNFPAFLLN